MDFDYFVAPTDQDISNAFMYAQNRLFKQVCDSDPENYTWIPDDIVPYPCPEGLECFSGRCVFNEKGCRAASSLSYYDCKRTKVNCDIPTHPDGTCEVCEYKIHDGEFTTPASNDPAIPTGCGPGDQRYIKYTNPAEDAESAPDTDKYICQGSVFDPEPYTINGKNGPQKVPCTSDRDCASSGAGGRCMLYPDRKATGYCVDTGAGYLEYRKNFTQYSELPGRDQCVAALPVFRKWCEMPWTRPFTPEDNLSEPLRQRISRHPQTKMHSPFYYDDHSGRCYVTDHYCSASLPNGGFNTGYGRSKEYLEGVFSSCGGSREGNQIKEGYDCCTPFGVSAANFFSSRTFTNIVEGVAKGEMSPDQLLYLFPETYAAMEFLSEDRLKQNKLLATVDEGGRGIHGYWFRWTPEARALYPQHTGDGLYYGYMMSEVQKVFPDAVRIDEHGNRFFVMVDEMYMNNPAYAHMWNLFKQTRDQYL